MDCKFNQKIKCRYENGERCQKNTLPVLVGYVNTMQMIYQYEPVKRKHFIGYILYPSLLMNINIFIRSCKVSTKNIISTGTFYKR